MKNKLLVTLLVMASAIAFAFGLTACGEKPHEHAYETTVTAPTCTEQGYTTHTCSCGDSYKDTYVNALGHNYDSKITAPTCTEQGYTTHTCSCGDSYVDSYVNALGHNFTNYVSDGNATYEQDGTKTAVCSRDGCNEKDTVTDEGSKLKSGISFKTLSVTGTDVYGKVGNATEEFSFINEVNAVGTAKFVVALDIYGSQQVSTKTIPLSIGDNTVYILETIDDELINVYTVTVRRRPMHEVTFNTIGGSSVESQTVEEDSLASQPTTIPSKTGYSFNSWEFDFNTPIIQKTTVNATWTINQYTITFVYGSGQDNKVIKQDYNTPIDKIEEPESIAGYDFCWDKEVPTTMPAEDIVITGCWNPIYTLSESMITGLTDYGRNHCTVLNIPSQIDGVAITSIGSYVFSGCSRLTSVTIPDSVTSIDSYAFSGCSSLTSVTIGTGVTSIGEYAFNDTAYYKDSNNWEDDVLYIGKYFIVANTSISGECTIKDGTLLFADYAFRNCYSLTSITIPNSVTSIGLAMFHNCSSLTSVTIPESITSIGYKAFELCGSLTSVTIPETVTSIGIYAFSGCSSLTSITIPDSVTSIGSNAFYDCSSLMSITIPDSITSISDYAFSFCSRLTSVTIPNSVTSIGSNAFSRCSRLTSITIPNSVTRIGWAAFSGCSSLTSITIPDSVTSIDSYAFDDCTNLTEINYYAPECEDLRSSNNTFYNAGQRGTGITVTIGANVKKIPAYLFSPYNIDSAPKITSVVFEEGSVCKSIGESAFEECGSLMSITIPKSVTSIGKSAFSFCSSLTSITIPDSVTSIGTYVFSGCSSLTSVVIPDRITSISDAAFSGCISLKSIKIPDRVKSIGVYAFRNCYSLTSITIPNSVTSIGDVAFRNCSSLTSVIIGKSVTSIDDYAFDYCYKLIEVKNLSSLTITAGSIKNGYVGYYAKRVYKEGESYLSTDENGYIIYNDGTDKILVDYVGTETELVLPSDITIINNYAFSGCISLTSITIPDGVTSIGSYAFKNCYSLTSITIPDSVTSIRSYAFSGCISLTSVTFENINGWWISTSSTETSGTSISSSDLADVSTATMYLTSTYCEYYWKRS